MMKMERKIPPYDLQVVEAGDLKSDAPNAENEFTKLRPHR
jgi:hypothetical protein